MFTAFPLPPEAFSSDQKALQTKLMVTVRLECFVAVSRVSKPSVAFLEAFERCLFSSWTVLGDRTVATCFWALGDLHLKQGDVSSCLLHWIHSIHLMFRILPISSKRLLRCVCRLLWVIATNSLKCDEKPVGLLLPDIVFAIVVESYQSGAVFHTCLRRRFFCHLRCIGMQGTLHTLLLYW
jgi:hypothetical protein